MKVDIHIIHIVPCSAVRRECPLLDNPENGVVKFKEGRRVGAKVWYFCNSGYTLVGSESRICKSDLTWSFKAPICKRKCINISTLVA